MVPEVKYFAVNWQDGMKVKTEHLIALENFIRDNIRDSASIFLNDYNYGLLPPLTGMSSPLKLKCDIIPGNKIRVVVMGCRAITAGGIRIERREEENSIKGINWIDCIHSLNKIPDGKLDVVISIDLFSRVAIGEPDPEENPPRRPEVVPKYSLKLLDTGTPISRLYELKVGEIIIKNGTANVAEEYIPPCSILNCYPPLFEHYRNFEKDLNTIENNSIIVFQKLRSGDAPEGIDTEILHENLQFFSEQIVFFFANNGEWYRKILPHLSPVYFVEFFVRLARIIYTLFRCMDNESKNNLLSYFRQWIAGVEPAKFEDALNTLLNVEYEHSSILSTLDKIKQFLIPLVKIFEKLPNLDYGAFEPPIMVKSKNI